MNRDYERRAFRFSLSPRGTSGERVGEINQPPLPNPSPFGEEREENRVPTDMRSVTIRFQSLEFFAIYKQNHGSAVILACNRSGAWQRQMMWPCLARFGCSPRKVCTNRLNTNGVLSPISAD